MKERIPYFAYGSNMDLEQMGIRCPLGFKVVAPGELERWKFIINQRGVATIVQQQDSKVYGVVFNLSSTCFRKLDQYEGYPLVYTRMILPVNTPAQELDCWVYIDRRSNQVGNPRPNYLERIIVAANSFKFPDDYVSYLKSFLPSV